MLEEDIINLVNEYDVFTISESSVNEFSFHLSFIKGYTTYHFLRKATSWRQEGGLLLLVSVLATHHGSYIDKVWIKIAHVVFCFLYLLHGGSVFLNNVPGDPMDELDGEILLYGLFGKVLLIGDFNAHTGPNPTPRQSVDPRVDQRGRQLLSMCLNRNLRILNGLHLQTQGRP